MNNYKVINDKFIDCNEDLKMDECKNDINNKYINYNEDFEIKFNEIFNPNEFLDVRKEEEEESKETNLIYFNQLFYNKEEKKTSKVNFNIATNFTSSKIHNIINLEAKSSSISPLELNLDINKNEILIEKEKEKKSNEDFIKKKRKEVDNCNTSEGNKKSGRKIKKLGISGKHNKYSDDNLIRKIKGIILNNAYEHCNNKIRTIYGKKKGLKILLKINSEQRLQSKVEFNKNFLEKTLKEIFSKKISDRYKNPDKNHNKDLIKDLLNEKDEKKRIQFESLFNLTFLDCLKHFGGRKIIKQLIGMKLFEEEIKKYRNDADYEDYKKFLEYYTKYFEDIITIKKHRIRKSKNS